MENKVHATQERTSFAGTASASRAAFQKPKLLLVFLTLHEEEAADPGWVAADYGQIAAVLRE